MEIDKPILTVDEQIEYLKSKDVRFSIMNEEQAKEYLTFHNNYFKLTAYDYYRLLTCKDIRNASAHSNCILNDLKAQTVTHKTNGSVTKALMSIDGMNSNFRKNRMSNIRIQQIVTFMYTHSTIVTSEGVRMAVKDELTKVLQRMNKNIDYYKDNQLIDKTFKFIKIVIDNLIIK